MCNGCRSRFVRIAGWVAAARELLQAARRGCSMADPTPATDDAPGGWARSVATVLSAVQRGPYAAMLAIGLLLIFAAFIKRIGALQVSATGSQPLMLGCGAVLCGIALVAPALGARGRQRQLVGGYLLPPEANDVDFMFQM